MLFIAVLVCLSLLCSIVLLSVCRVARSEWD